MLIESQKAHLAEIQEKQDESDTVSIEAAEDFEEEHEKTYGHRLPGFSFAIQSLRLVATIPTRRPELTRIGGGADSATTRGRTQSTRKAYWGKKHGIIDTPVLQLEEVEPIWLSFSMIFF